MAFLKAHDGEYPAYIPLLRNKVVFILGNNFFGGKPIDWSGKGKLPDEVLEHVSENGTLPHYE